jgi:squalene synthase HpnC
MDLAAELAQFGPDTRREPPSPDEALAYCRQLARSHYENFTVASRLFPRHLHQHLANVYAYCRWADDLADEAGDPARSLALLDWWEEQLDGLYAGPGTPRRAFPTATTHPVFVALGETMQQFALPRQPLVDLLVAFRRDQRQTRYETLADLLTYCQCSANPVGRIVLALGRAGSDENMHLSDQVCTGLQLANFCQDVRRDWQRGRIYLPLDLCRRHNWDESRFAAGRCDDDFRRLLKELADEAESRLLAGRPLARQVPRDLRLPVRVFVEGGLAILAAIRRARYDVWSRRPTVGRWTKLRLLARAWWSG